MMKTEIMWRDVVRVWWAHLWRSLIAFIAATFVGGAAGGMLGAALQTFGVAAELVAVVVGAAIFIGFSIIPMKLILGKDFGEFRIVLVANARRGNAG